MSPITILWRLLPLLAAAHSATVWASGPGPEKQVANLALQADFQTRQRWQLQVFQPSGAEADVGIQAARVCLQGPIAGPAPPTDCSDLIAVLPAVPDHPYPLQTIDKVSLTSLPDGTGRSTRPAVVIEASYHGGGAGMIHQLLLWSDLDATHHAGRFALSFRSSVSEAGDQAFIQQGPLKGYFVAVDQVGAGNEADMEQPRRYLMRVYAPAPLGYVQVLSTLSLQRYPSNHTRDGLSNAISTLTPEISHALQAVYPQGVPNLAD